jgi:putative flippase GtrA
MGSSMIVKINLLFTKVYNYFESFFPANVSFKQICKFCGVGIINTIVGYGVYFILVNYIFYLIALLIAHIIGVINSFLWNKYWTFQSKRFTLIEFIKFNLVYALVFIINAIALFVCVNELSFDPKISQLVLLPVITLVSFFGQKFWTFKGK